MFYLGMDVAKATLDYCLLLDEVGGRRKIKVVPKSKAGVVAFLEWSAKQGVPATPLHVVMEATGVYHEPAALALVDAGVTVSIINPAQVKDFGRGRAVRTKTDGVDSAVLARYGALLKPAAWQPPPPEARTLQALLARRDAVAEDLRRELNRQEKSGVIETHTQITDSLAKSIAFLEAELKRLQKTVDEHLDRHPDLKRDMTLLTSIPAVGERVGNTLLAVMHAHHFESAEQVAAYLGLVSVERQSGSSLLGRQDSRRRVRPACGRCCIWPPLSPQNAIRTSKRFTNACSPEENPRCQHSVRRCASWCIYALACLKPRRLISQHCKKNLTSKTVSTRRRIFEKLDAKRPACSSSTPRAAYS